MGVFESLGEVLGKGITKVTDQMLEILKFRKEMLTEFDIELVQKSLDPDKFPNPDVKKLVERIRKSLSGSPETLSDWVQTVFTDVFSAIHEVMQKALIPYEIPDFEAAKANAGYLSTAFSGFILLASVLDATSTALSATLVRNVFRYISFMLQFFGFQKYMDIALMPAVTASILPVLEQGYNAQFQTAIPGSQDLISMAVREAFSPEIAKAFGQYEDFPEAIVPFMEMQGLSREWSERYWATHWGLPGATAGYEMLHRGVIDEDTLKLLLRAQDVMPFWRDKLMAISWNVPTRVDLRRFWDMRTIDEARMREIYMGLGYHGKDLDDYMLWTKVYSAMPDLEARWKNGWITQDDFRRELISLGMPENRVEELIQTKVKAVEAGQVESGKELTKSEIYKGVKQGWITRDEGIDLLMDLNYTMPQAEYLLDVNVAVLEGSPDNWPEFKDLTQKYRMAAGLKAAAITQEMKQAAADVVQLTKEVADLTRAVNEEQDKILDEDTVPDAVKSKLNEVRVSLHRAEAELKRVKDHYDSLVAAWRRTRVAK